MVLACFGPSLKNTLEELKAEAPFGDVFTVSGAHDFLIDNGVSIRGHIESDPRGHKQFFLSRPREETSYLIASTCDREVYRALHGHDVNIWHVSSSDEETALIAKAWPGSFVVSPSGTNVGQSAIPVGSALGYRRFSVYAMDCSFEAPQWVLDSPSNAELSNEAKAAINYHAGDHPNEDQFPYRVWVGDRPFLVSPQMMQSAQDFLVLRRTFPHFRITLHGDGFLKNLVAAIDSGKPLVTPGRTAGAKLTLREFA